VAAAGILLLVAGGLLIRLASMEALVFMPRRLTLAEADPGAWGVAASAVRIPVEENQWLYGWLFPRQPIGRRRCGTVLLLHGNAGNLTQFRGLGQWLAGSGLRVLAVDYRGYGASPGRPSENNLQSDVRAAYRYIRDVLHEPTDHLVVVGHSLGAILAVGIAGQDSIAGLILFSAAPSVGPLIRQRSPLLATLLHSDDFRFDATELLSRVRAPTMVITGENDMLVRVSDARAVLQRAGGRPADLIVIDGAGHNGLWDHPIAWQAMNRLLDRALPACCEEPT
jgi:hypothetical protein